jgi:polysaccharide export outer membrane protein
MLSTLFEKTFMKKMISMCVAIFPALMVTAILLAATGCQTSQPKLPPVPPHSEALILREGDVLTITFPGAPNLNTTTTIRRDGKITLQMVGEITAAGVAPADLEKEIVKAYGDQLISKVVTLTVVSSTIPVFVTGAVLTPHKVVADHPITALEAIMEAGGFDYTKANMKDVRVIRYENGRSHVFILNLKEVLQGKQVEPFYVKPFDMIYVPERFSMY